MSKPVIPPIDLVKLQHAHEAAWAPAYTQFLRLIKARGLSTGVEVGVGYGGHCEALLDYRGIDSLVGVDPYQHLPQVDDPTNLDQRDLDRVYHGALDRLARFGRRFELMRESSARAAERFEEGSLDFVYIDADHRFESVIADLGAWCEKVRVNGVIAGHDYENPDLPGVQHAVDSYFQRLGWPVHHAGDCVWWVQKRALPISYIIPAYNAEQTLWQAVSSVMDDNLDAGDELLVVEDGSTDATGVVLDELQAAYPALRVIRQEHNSGAGAARNRGVNEAANDLIFMLDADNVLPTDAVKPLRNHLMRVCCDAVCFGEVRLFRDGDEPNMTAWTHRYPSGQATLEEYGAMQDPPGAAGNLLFTRDAWQRAGGYPEHAGALDSWGLGLRLVATGSCLGVCNDSYYDHRIGHESYWQREHQPGRTDRLALSLLRPYFSKLTTASQFYLLQSENQERWFSELEKRPIRVVNGSRAGLLPTITHNLQSIRQRLAKLVSRAA